MKIRELFQVENRSAIEKWCREHTQQCYVGEHTALARVLGNFLMYVDTRDLSLSPHMLMNGFWEMWVTQAIVDYVKPGMRCIDVGANCGYYTALLAELVGEKGFVQAYEPQLGLADLLRKTISVNGFHQAQVSSMVVSNRSGRTPFYSYGAYLGSASTRPGKYLDPEELDYPTASLDDEGFGPPCAAPIDFVKIDAQGSEMEVLAGMKRMLECTKKIAIAMEFTPDEHEDPRAALESIRDGGLSIRSIGTDGQVRPISIEDALTPDTGDHRMLWLSKG